MHSETKLWPTTVDEIRQLRGFVVYLLVQIFVWKLTKVYKTRERIETVDFFQKQKQLT